MMANLSIKRRKVMEFIFFQRMDLSIKVSGEMTKDMEKEGIRSKMEDIMMVNGLRENDKVKDRSLLVKIIIIQEVGKMIKNKVLEYKNRFRGIFIKEISNKISNMGRERSHMQMEISIKVILVKIFLKGKVAISLKIMINMKVAG